MFDWENELSMPDPVDFEFREEAINRVQTFIYTITSQSSKNIAFPEFIFPVLQRLERFVQRNNENQFVSKIIPIANLLREQSTMLKEIKKDLEWNNRDEEQQKWNEAIEEIETPLENYLNREKRVEERIKQMATPKEEELDTGDIVTIATVDDF